MKTREEMIEAVVNNIENWDMDSTIEFAMDCMEEKLQGLDTNDLEQVYFDTCVGD